MTLAELKIGEEAIIEKVEGEFAIKLLEMGCIPKTKVKMLQIAPLLSTFAIEILGYMLALRKEEAAQIEVVKC